MKNNISSAAHLFEPDLDITKNITTKNNTVNAPESMFKDWLKTLQAPTNFRITF